MRLSREEIRNISWENYYRFSIRTDTMTSEMEIQGSIGSVLKFDAVEIGHLPDGSAVWRYATNPANIFPGIPEAKSGEKISIVRADEPEENLQRLTQEMDPEIFKIFLRQIKRYRESTNGLRN